MGELARKTSPAAELADERFIEAVGSAERYPDGASFIGADEPHFGAVLAEAVATEQPLVVIYDDGKELIGTPDKGVLSFTLNPPALSARERLRRSLAHPVRVRLIVLLTESTISPHEAASELGLPLNDVAYHFRMLVKYGAISLDRTEQRRGAVEHFYSLTDLVKLDADWFEMPHEKEQG